jgi:hypothetical protein
MVGPTNVDSDQAHHFKSNVVELTPKEDLSTPVNFDDLSRVVSNLRRRRQSDVSYSLYHSFPLLEQRIRKGFDLEFGTD